MKNKVTRTSRLQLCAICLACFALSMVACFGNQSVLTDDASKSNSANQANNALTGNGIDELRVRGEYIVHSQAACGSCHGGKSSKDDLELSGGRVISDRFGDVAVANITPDFETGIGGWNISDVIQAMRASVNKDGKPLSLDAHGGYRWMSDRDARAIATYLMAMAPVKNNVARRELGPFQRKKLGLISRHKEIQGYVPSIPQKVNISYGRYLTHNVAGCFACHTSKGGLFSKETGFSGNEDISALRIVKSEEFSGAVRSPDIRGNLKSGLGLWSVEDIGNYLSTGITPNGEHRNDNLCPWDHFSKMTDADKKAISLYLKTLS